MECKFCHETIYQPPLENYWVHSRTGTAMCGIRYAAPRAWDSEDWSEFWAGYRQKDTETGMNSASVSKVDAKPLLQPDLIEGCNAYFHTPRNPQEIELWNGVDWFIPGFCPKCGEKL